MNTAACVLTASMATPVPAQPAAPAMPCRGAATF